MIVFTGSWLGHPSPADLTTFPGFAVPRHFTTRHWRVLHANCCGFFELASFQESVMAAPDVVVLSGGSGSGDSILQEPDAGKARGPET